jgi:hypothetical protein
VEEGGEMYYCVPWVEACGLVTMCSYRSVTRRLSLVLLKEIRSLHMALQIEVGIYVGTDIDRELVSSPYLSSFSTTLFIPSLSPSLPLSIL